MHSQLGLLAFSLLMISCTAAPHATTDAPRCFRASSITGFTDAGPDRAIIQIGSREKWELTLSSGCPDVDWAMSIGIHSRGGERICEGRPAEIFVPEASGGGSRQCLVTEARRLEQTTPMAPRPL